MTHIVFTEDFIKSTSELSTMCKTLQKYVEANYTIHMDENQREMMVVVVLGNRMKFQKPKYFLTQHMIVKSKSIDFHHLLEGKVAENDIYLEP